MASLFNKKPIRASVLAGCMSICCLLVLTTPSAAQDKDSMARVAPTPVVRDSADIADSLRRIQIRKVTRHSAIIPGWGQINNKQAWKVPFVYAAIGIPAYLYFDNKRIYTDLRNTYILLTDKDPSNDDQIKDEYKPLSPNSVKYYRDQYRKNMDYSVLAFVIAWGLNVVDATVFANLRDFDVSDNLSMRITPKVDPLQRTAGLGFVLKASNNKPRTNYQNISR